MKLTDKFHGILNYSFTRFVITYALLLLGGCQNDPSRSQRYYYSDEGLEKSLPDSSAQINLDDNKSVKFFISNKTFVSKTQRLVIDDSLKVTLFVNGKKEAVMKCEITEYMVHNDRLLLFTDLVTSKQAKYTISGNGILTDMQTYALYTVKK